MTDLEVNIPSASKAFARLETVIDELLRSQELSVTMKTTASKYPGSMHWHLKKGRERGTLEVTLWPSQKRLWFSMQDGRKGEWVMPMARLLKQQLESL